MESPLSQQILSNIFGDDHDINKGLLHFLSSIFDQASIQECIMDHVLQLIATYDLMEASYHCLLNIGYLDISPDLLRESLQCLDHHVDLTDQSFCGATTAFLNYAFFILQSSQHQKIIYDVVNDSDFRDFTSILSEQPKDPFEIAQRVLRLAKAARDDPESCESINPCSLPVYPLPNVELDFESMFGSNIEDGIDKYSGFNKGMFRPRKRRSIEESSQIYSYEEPISITTGAHRRYVAPMRGFGYNRAGRGGTTMQSTGIRSLMATAWNDSLRSGRIPTILERKS
ncbi:hypothetical protein ACOME3_001996 [Neoechinorhynchus agilis]